jgi:tetratricopeptide (TPR) repeat protein
MLRRSHPLRFSCALGESRPRASLAHAKGLMKAVHGLDHLDMAASHFTLALVHFLQSKYEKALELNQKSLDIIIRVRGRDHMDVAAVYNNMSCIYYKQRKYEEALALYNKSLDIFLKVCGPQSRVDGTNPSRGLMVHT